MKPAVAPVPTTNIEQIRPPREVDPRFVGGIAVTAELTSNDEAFGMFAEVNAQAGYLDVPNYLGQPGERVQVPSVEVVTHRDRQGKCQRARIIDLHNAHPGVSQLYEAAARAARTREGEDRMPGIVYSTAQRMLTNRGANGLHHVYGTEFGGATVFYSISNGNGPHVFMARIGYAPRNGAAPRDGEDSGPIPVLAVIGATADETAARKLWKIMGSAPQDSRSWRKS